MKKLDKRSIATLAAVAIMLVVLTVTGGGETFSGVKLGYVSSKSRVHWQASYAKLDGSMSKMIFPEKESYLLTVVTHDGSFDISVVGEDGEIVMDLEDVPTGEYSLTLQDITRVTIRAEDHRGSFSLEPME